MEQNYVQIDTVFIHVPKTAGTFVIEYLRSMRGIAHCDIIGKRKFETDYVPNLKNSITKKELEKNLKMNPFAKSISSHFLLLKEENLKLFPNATFFSVMRNPKKRLISDYAHKCRIKNELVCFEKWFEKRKILQKEMISGDIPWRKFVTLLKTKKLQLFFQHEIEKLTEYIAYSNNMCTPNWVDTGRRINSRKKIESLDNEIERELGKYNLSTLLEEEEAFYNKVYNLNFGNEMKEKKKLIKSLSKERASLNLVSNRLWRNVIYKPLLRICD